MKRRTPSIRFLRSTHDPEAAYWAPSASSHRITITLPDLPDGVVRYWHGFLRESLMAFENQYEDQLARAYGWVRSADGDEEDEEGSDWDDQDI